ncbi:MAG: hypothetical protein ACTSUI_02605 [Promethearchaeota archaeon]
MSSITRELASSLDSFSKLSKRFFPPLKIEDQKLGESLIQEYFFSGQKPNQSLPYIIYFLIFSKSIRENVHFKKTLEKLKTHFEIKRRTFIEDLVNFSREFGLEIRIDFRYEELKEIISDWEKDDKLNNLLDIKKQKNVKTEQESSLIENAIRIINSNNTRFLENIPKYCKEIAIQICREFGTKLNSNSRIMASLALKIAGEYYNDPITFHELGQIFNVSEQGLRNRFSKIKKEKIFINLFE